MTYKIALLRSVVINRQRVKMKDLREIASRATGAETHSVISTGNLIFYSELDSALLEKLIETGLREFYGGSTDVIVRTVNQWRKLLESNPYQIEALDLPSRLLVWIMRTPIPESGIIQLRSRAHGNELIGRTDEGDFYVWFGETPIEDSKIPAGFGLKYLGAIGTNRNWNTAKRITLALDKMVISQ